MKLILGSSSSGRQMLMREAGFNFEVVAPDIDEKAIRHNDPKELVKLIAKAKSDALLSQVSDPAIIITADTVVYFDGGILEKASLREQAANLLKRYHTKPVDMITGIAVANTINKRQLVDVDVGTVWLKELPEDVLNKHLEEGAADHAGSLMLEDKYIQPYILKIEGRMDTIIGLNIDMVKDMMEKVK